VVDLAEAHVLALEGLRAGKLAAETLNLGNGSGFSVSEVLDVVERVAGRRPPTVPAPRRPGDPAVLVASADRARRRLGWRPTHADLEAIVRTAWGWHVGHPRGFGEAPSAEGSVEGRAEGH
jgi:UDP-glucose 4-epimerase